MRIGKRVIGASLLLSLSVMPVSATILEFDVEGGDIISFSRFDGVDYDYQDIQGTFQRYTTTAEVGTPSWFYDYNDSFFDDFAQAMYYSASAEVGYALQQLPTGSPNESFLLGQNPFALTPEHDFDAIGIDQYFTDQVDPAQPDYGSKSLRISWSMAAFGDERVVANGSEYDIASYYWDAYIWLGEINDPAEIQDYSEQDLFELLADLPATFVSVSETANYEINACVPDAFDPVMITCSTAWQETYSTYYTGFVSAAQAAATVPAPHTMALALMGLVGVGWCRRRQA